MARSAQPIGDTVAMASPTVPQSLPPSKRGRVWIIIGSILVVVGIVGGAALTINGALDIGHTVNAYERVSLVSGGSIEIDEPGTYRIFFEAPGADQLDGSSGAFRITGPAGESIATSSDLTSETYSIGGRDGRKVGTFRAEQAGTYQFQPIRQDGSAGFGGAGNLAIGRKGPVGSIVTILGGVFGGLFVVALGVGAIIIGAVQRGRAKRAAMGPSGPMGFAGPFGAPMPGWAPPASTSTTWSPPGWAPASAPSAPGRAGWAPPPPAPGRPPAPPSLAQGWAPSATPAASDGWPPASSPEPPPLPGSASMAPPLPGEPPPLPSEPPPLPEDRPGA